MNCAVIDIGSNSMRLSVYEVQKDSFTILFKEKIMAGLAGYVNNGALSKEGIKCACDGLLEFKKITEYLGIDNISVFATASLRNISNTDEAVGKIKEVAGFEVEVISGYEEAVYGYTGAMTVFNDMKEGVFTDIGGASAEIVYFSEGNIKIAESIPVGSLKLFSQCVSKIIPKKTEQEKISGEIKKEIKKLKIKKFPETDTLCCVGGTGRAMVKLAKHIFGSDSIDNKVTSTQLAWLSSIILSGTDEALSVILKVCPERIHTIIPGIMILQNIVEKFGVKEIVVSSYGVREGYLCQKIQKSL